MRLSDKTIRVLNVIIRLTLLLLIIGLILAIPIGIAIKQTKNNQYCIKQLGIQKSFAITKNVEKGYINCCYKKYEEHIKINKCEIFFKGVTQNVFG